MPEEAGPQAEPGLLPAEASPEDHQIPAAPQGETVSPMPGWAPPGAQQGYLTATFPAQPRTRQLWLPLRL